MFKKKDRIFGILIIFIILSLVSISSYTAPNYNSINFTLCDSYTPPTYNSINFTLGETENCGDNTAPIITINYPENTTYEIEEIIFNITSTDEDSVDTCQYSLDGGSNVTMYPELLTVSGSVDYPEMNGLYSPNGSFNGKTRFKQEGKEWYVLAHYLHPRWVISQYPNAQNVYWFRNLSDGILGIYNENFPQTGQVYVNRNDASDNYIYTNSSMTSGQHNITYSCNDSSGNWNLTEPVYFKVNLDSCKYEGSGDWIIQSSDFCNLTTNTDLLGNNILINGSGTTTITANLTNYTDIKLQGINSIDRAIVICKDGGCFK